MKVFFCILSLFTFLSACQTQNLGFISSNRQEVTVGYIKYTDNTRRSEGSQETDADVAVNASIDFINRMKIFPFQMKLLTYTFNSSEPSEIAKSMVNFSKIMPNVAAWIGSKNTTINVAIDPMSLSLEVPVFFPITSKTLFTQGYPNLYQPTPSNGAFGLQTWNLARKLNIKKLLIIEDTSIIYSGEYGAAFLGLNKINHNAIETRVIPENFTKNKAEILHAISDALKDTSYDAVFFPGFANDISSVLEVMESLGLRIPLLAGDEGSDSGIFSGDKLKGLSKVYYLTYYPSALSADDNTQTKTRIEDFNRFETESGTGSLLTLQLYYSTPLIIGEIINDVLEENSSIPNRESFYEQFNNIAKTKPLLGLVDRPIHFTANGTLSLTQGDLFISTNSKKDGIQTIGTL